MIKQIYTQLTKQKLQWNFIIANVSRPNIGVDFLHYFNLSVDLRYKKLIENDTGLKSYGQIVKRESLGFYTISKIDKYHEI